jgi:hypothetical protein
MGNGPLLTASEYCREKNDDRAAVSTKVELKPHHRLIWEPMENSVGQRLCLCPFTTIAVIDR